MRRWRGARQQSASARCATSGPASPRSARRGRCPTSRRSRTSTSQPSRSRSRNHCRARGVVGIEGSDHEHAPPAQLGGGRGGAVTRSGARAPRIPCRRRCAANGACTKRAGRGHRRARDGGGNPSGLEQAPAARRCVPRACRLPRPAASTPREDVANLSGARDRGRRRSWLNRTTSKPAFSRRRRKRVAFVAAVVTDELVGRAVVVFVRGHAQEQPARRPQVLAPLLQRERVVFDVLEHLERAHDVELTIGDVGELRVDRAAAVGGDPGFGGRAGLVVELDAGVGVVTRRATSRGRLRRRRSRARWCGCAIRRPWRISSNRSHALVVSVGSGGSPPVGLCSVAPLSGSGGVAPAPLRTGQAVAVEQGQGDRRGDEAVARRDPRSPLLVGLDGDRAARHAHRVAAHRVGRCERRGLRREELHARRPARRRKSASRRSTPAGSRAISSYCTTSTGPRRRMASTTRLRASQLVVEYDALNLGMYSPVSRSVVIFDRFHEYTTARGSRMTCAIAHVDAGNEAEGDRLDRQAGRVDDDTRARHVGDAPVDRRRRRGVAVECIPARLRARLRAQQPQHVRPPHDRRLREVDPCLARAARSRGLEQLVGLFEDGVPRRALLHREPAAAAEVRHEAPVPQAG